MVLEGGKGASTRRMWLSLRRWARLARRVLRRCWRWLLLWMIGPVWWMSWLLLPVEIISHFARILSLTVRLYANMFAGDLLTLVFFSMVPIGVPLVFLGLHLGVAVIQAYVFMLLAAIYLSLAVAHEH